LDKALTAIGGLEKSLNEVRAAQDKGVGAHLSPKSLKSMQETIAVCARLEQLSAKLEGAASRVFEQVQSKLLAPEGLHSCLNAYHEWLLQRCGPEDERIRLIEALPRLFDFVEMELRSCRVAASLGSLPPERQSVLAELEKLDRRIRDWQKSVGLTRFPEPGELFDPSLHQADESVVTDDAGKVNSIKEVIRSGYRFGDGPPLRSAIVVCWVRPRGK
jgi:hypothetical protein